MHRLRRPVQLTAACLCLAGGLVSGAVEAAIDCTASTTGVDFGDYDPLLTTPDDSTANVTVRCTRQIFVDPFNVSYTLALSRGSSGNYALRRMNAGAARLNYNLYRDAARSQVWGDGTNSTGMVAGAQNFVWFQTSQTSTHAIYGRVPAQQNATPGSFSDAIVLTITF